MSGFSKGLVFEKEFSKGFHSIGTPLLIDSSHLRGLGAGQIDCARFIEGQKKRVEVVELKCGENMSKKQRERIFLSCQYIGELLGVCVSFEKVQKVIE